MFAQRSIINNARDRIVIASLRDLFLKWREVLNQSISHISTGLLQHEISKVIVFSENFMPWLYIYIYI